MKWETIKHYYKDGTCQIRGYRMAAYTIEPFYIFGNNKPISYNVFKNGERITT